MKTRHKNIFKAGLQLCAALLGTLLSFFHITLASVLKSDDEDDLDSENTYVEEKDGTLIFYKKN